MSALVLPGRHSSHAPECAYHVALIAETAFQRHLRAGRSEGQSPFCFPHPDLIQISMRREAYFP